LVTLKIKHLATHKCVKDWGKMAPRQGWGRRAPSRFRVGMLNLSGKVRFGKVYLSSDYKTCHNVNVFSQGLLQLTCAKFAYGG